MAVRFTKFKLRKSDKWDLEGVGDLDRNLEVLERDLRKRIVIDGLFKGSDVTLARVRRLVPKGEGALARSIVRKKGKASVRIQAGSKEAFYVGWVEYGTDPHEIRPRGRRRALRIGSGLYARADHPGARAKPFLRPAMDETRDEVVRIAARSIRADVDRLRFHVTDGKATLATR